MSKKIKRSNTVFIPVMKQCWSHFLNDLLWPTCGWRSGCCCVPFPGIFPSAGQSERLLLISCSSGTRTLCSSTDCTLVQICPLLADPLFLKNQYIKHCKRTHRRQMRREKDKLEVISPTELLHALLVRFIQEKIALFYSTMYLETQAQTGVFHQLRVDVMDQGLQHER